MAAADRVSAPRWSTSKREQPRRPGWQLCSCDMMCDVVCFILLGIAACYFLKFMIDNVLDDEPDE